jgi:hypothetical protein
MMVESVVIPKQAAGVPLKLVRMVVMVVLEN